jgi:hypothetical protein
MKKKRIEIVSYRSYLKNLKEHADFMKKSTKELEILEVNFFQKI